ncbi:MAG: YggT family protein [Solirubrobacterales bacterium]|nr:YggT family protein [Solirubrobacterales bacterium]
MIVIAASTRSDISDYVAALVEVYTLIIIVYIVSTMILSFGVRIPYHRWSDALLSFLGDVTNPYLNLFRRFIPMVGPLDLSPIAAILVLQVVGTVVVNLVRG